MCSPTTDTAESSDEDDDEHSSINDDSTICTLLSICSMYVQYNCNVHARINSSCTHCKSVEGPSTVNVHRISSPPWSSGDRLHLLVICS